MDAREFSRIYWASKHPAVRALRDAKPGPDQDDIDMLPWRTEQAFKLSDQGHVIDALIDVHFATIASAPWLIMAQRASYGYTWVPSVGMANIAMAPGVFGPQAPAYDPLRPPPRSIKVSVNPIDYPPFEVPAQIVIDPVSPVGVEIMPGGGRYHSTLADTYKIGDKWQEWVKRGTPTPFGLSVWWEKAA